MPTKRQRIVQYILAHPEASASEVAKALDTTKGYVYCVRYKTWPRRLPAKIGKTMRERIEEHLKAHPEHKLSQVAKALRTTKGYVSLVKRGKVPRNLAGPVAIHRSTLTSEERERLFGISGDPNCYGGPMPPRIAD